MSTGVVFQGSIVAGPQGSSDCGFPSGVTNIQFGGNTIPAGVMTGDMVRSVNSAADYVDLDGVGSDQAVTQATFFFLRTQSPIFVRVTFQPTSGGDIVSVIPVQGVVTIQAPPTNYIKGLEAMGVATIEYFASGPQ